MKRIICVFIALSTLLCTGGCKKKENMQESKVAETNLSSVEMESTQPTEMLQETQPSIDNTDIKIEPGVVEIAGLDVHILSLNDEFVPENRIGDIDAVAIPDYETAVLVASQIWESVKKTYQSELMADTVPSTVIYYSQSDVWVVAFTKPIDYSAESIFVGPEFGIALRRSDGAVLKIWMHV